MKIVCIGDSLTEGDYGVFGKSGIADVRSKNYPFFLAQSAKAAVINHGHCGITPSGFWKLYKEGGANVSGADIIVVMLGTNGGLDPAVATDGNRDYASLITAMHKEAPQAHIVLCTPPHATKDPTMSNYGYAPQVEKAVEFVRAFAKEKQLPLIDVAACTEFSAEAESVMQPNDGLHFSEIGYRTLAAFIEQNLRRLFAEKF